MKTRKESDSFGELDVPENAYYGVHTVRSVQNFPISGLRIPFELIKGIALLKLSCAKANHAQGNLSLEKTEAIVQASREVIAGEMADQFPVDLFQAGSGTSTNMNINEVIAARATEILGGNHSFWV